MKRIALFSLILCFTIASSFLAGCTNNQKDNGISKEATAFSVVDDQNKGTSYLTESHPEVIKAKKFEEDFNKVLFTRDYKTMSGDDEYGFYTRTLVEALTSANDKASNLISFINNEIQQKYESSNIKEIQFNKDFTIFTTEYTVNYTLVNASADFTKETKKEKGKTYPIQITFKAVKSGDTWKIDSIALK